MLNKNLLTISKNSLYLSCAHRGVFSDNKELVWPRREKKVFTITKFVINEVVPSGVYVYRILLGKGRSSMNIRCKRK